MKNTLENVHVVIYGKKHLKEAIKWLQHYDQDIEADIKTDWKHDNNYLTFYNGKFGLRQVVVSEDSQEVTLTKLVELVIAAEASRIKTRNSVNLTDGDVIYFNGLIVAIISEDFKHLLPNIVELVEKNMSR